MRTLAAMIVFAALAPVSASAQKPASTPSNLPTLQAPASGDSCKRLTRAIHRHLKEIASLTVGGMSETSAIRESNRLLSELSSLTLIQTAVTQMAALKCPMLTENLEPDRYVMSALKCRSFMTSTGIKLAPEEEAKKEEACKRDNWLPLPESE